jgi:hypothetical protein
MIDDSNPSFAAFYTMFSGKIIILPSGYLT